MDDTKYLSAPEFAKAIGVHINTVNRWAASGQLLPHHTSPGGRRFYSQQQVDDYFGGENSDR